MGGGHISRWRNMGPVAFAVLLCFCRDFLLLYSTIPYVVVLYVKVMGKARA
jgi:hypothetical protein